MAPHSYHAAPVKNAVKKLCCYGQIYSLSFSTQGVAAHQLWRMPETLQQHPKNPWALHQMRRRVVQQHKLPPARRRQIWEEQRAAALRNKQQQVAGKQQQGGLAGFLGVPQPHLPQLVEPTPFPAAARPAPVQGSCPSSREAAGSNAADGSAAGAQRKLVGGQAGQELQGRGGERRGWDGSSHDVALERCVVGPALHSAPHLSIVCEVCPAAMSWTSERRSCTAGHAGLSEVAARVCVAGSGCKAASVCTRRVAACHA